ncbi:MAG: EI24 domain-containing protein [Halobacteriovoraceae bacterium]|nr:EI24 domain-containing protein [Halobacteriovoraceae bacterium]
MKNVYKVFKQAISYIFSDKINLLFASVPILLGLLIYYFAFYSTYDVVMNWLNSFLSSLVQSDGFWGIFITYFVKTILFVLSFFFINWTFVLVVTTLASPFNDLISERVEKTIKGLPQEQLDKSLKRIIKRLGFTIINESKKMLFIIVLTFIALVLGYIPILAPFSLLITFFLVSIEFVDYAWSRHSLPFGSCVGNLTQYSFHYLVAGALYFLFINIPVFNLLVPSIATAHFTTFYIKKTNQIEI